MGKTYKDISKTYKTNKNVEYFKGQRKDRRLARGRKHFEGDITMCETIAYKRLLTNI